MLPTLILQLLIDLLFTAVIVWLYLQHKKQSAMVAMQSTDTNLNQQWKEMREQMGALKEKLDAELKRVQSLHDRLEKLVSDGLLTGGIFPTSLEEKEIRTLIEQKDRTDSIPVLSSVEKTKERLRSESLFDLKTLLQGQLT